MQSKEETIDYLVDLISQSGIIPDKEEYKQGILLRESLGTTAIGDEIAIPHAQLDSIKAPGIAAITVKNGVDYDAPDGQNVKLCFIIAAPKTGDNLHLQALAKLSTLLMNPSFKESLLRAKTTEEFLQIINEAESQRDMLDMQPEGKKSYRVLAVTACPTGTPILLWRQRVDTGRRRDGLSVKGRDKRCGWSKKRADRRRNRKSRRNYYCG